VDVFREHIPMTPGWETSSWPDDRNVVDNLRDLRRHADDFENKAGFTYTVLDSATGEVIGCVYIYPDDSEQHDARVLMGAGEPARARRAAVAGGHRLARGRVAVRACDLRRAGRRRLTHPIAVFEIAPAGQVATASRARPRRGRARRRPPRLAS